MNYDFIKTASYINGQWRKGQGGVLWSPTQHWWDHHQYGANESDTLKAVDTTAAALPSWRQKTANERSKVLKRWFVLIMQNQEELAQLLACKQWECGVTH